MRDCDFTSSFTGAKAAAWAARCPAVRRALPGDPRRRVRFHHFFRTLERPRDARLVERLQDVVHGIYFESLNGVMIVGGGENDLRYRQLALDQFFDHAEAVEARHLHIEEHQIRLVLLDQRNGFEAVLALGDHVDLGKTLQQVTPARRARDVRRPL